MAREASGILPFSAFASLETSTRPLSVCSRTIARIPVALAKEESVEQLVKQGATHITVATTMFTPGGSHSEVEIPEILEHLRPQYPGVELRYAWPFDLSLVAGTLAEQVRRFS